MNSNRKIKIRKILAVILSVITLLSVLPLGGLVSLAAESERIYTKINDISELVSGERYLFINTVSSDGEFMTSSISTGTQGDKGFVLQRGGMPSLTDTITGDFAAYEWKLYQQNGSKWRLKSGDNYAKLSAKSGSSWSDVSLVSTGASEFSIGGSGGSFTFTTNNGSSDVVLNNHGNNHTIGGWPDGATPFAIYKYTGIVSDNGTWAPVQVPTYSYTPVTIYVQQDSLTAGQTYVIGFSYPDNVVMDRNGSNFVDKTVTRNNAGSTGYYTNNRGTALYTANNYYIVDETNAGFTTCEYLFTSNKLQHVSTGNYIRQNNTSATLDTQTNGATFTLTNNQLVANDSNYKLRRNNSGYSFSIIVYTTARLYQKMTVYKQVTTMTDGGYCMYNGQSSFTVNKGSTFNVSTVENAVSVLYRDDLESTDYTTLKLSDPNVSLVWDNQVNTNVLGNYTAKVYAYGKLLDTITVTVIDEGAVLTNKRADPSTSDIRKLFPGIPSDDGKIATDKTVSDSSDEFGAFTGYEDDEFSIALSALGQSYTVVETEETVIEEKIHPDVVFVIDESGSMRIYNVAGGEAISRAEATATALNGAIKALYESDPETRIGIVSFSHQYNELGVYLPLDKYTLPEGQEDYILWNGRNVAVASAPTNVNPLLNINVTATTYYFPTTGTVSTTNNTALQRFQINTSGRIRLYNAGGTSYTTISYGLASGSYVEYSDYVFYRNGNTYSVYNKTAFNNSIKYAYDFKTTSASQSVTLTTNSTAPNNTASNFGPPSDVTPTTIATVNGITYSGYASGTDSSAVYYIFRSDVKGYVAWLTSDYPTYADDNITINRGSSAAVTYTTNTYTKQNVPVSFQRENITGLMSTNFLINSKDEVVKPSSYLFGTGMGTYTQAGLQAAENMYKEYATGDLTNRVPAIVLISDGIPTVGCSDTENPSLAPSSKTSGNGMQTGVTSDLLCNLGLYTIKTSKKVKENVTQMYNDGGSTRGSLFYSIGPGVSYIFGQLILDPNEENMQKAQNTTTAGGGEAGDGVPRDLYNKIINEYGSALDFVDYVDWSYTGNMSSDELSNAFLDIVKKLAEVSRPISTTVKSSGTQDIFKEHAAMIFTDVIGDGMQLRDVPVLRYNDINYRPTSSETKTENGVTIVTYHYNYNIKEQSTQKTFSLSNVGVEVITDSTGKQTVKWYIPSEIVPIILYDTETKTYNFCDPVRLIYKVGITDETVMDTYYANSTKDPANAQFTPVVGNPYYYNNVEGADGKLHSYLKTNNDRATDKTSNPTNTLTYSSSVKVGQDGNVTIYLGNNGVETLLYKINPDIVVVDYGIPVTIDILSNDYEVRNGSVSAIATAINPDTVTEYKSYTTSQLQGQKATNNGELNLVHGKAKLSANKIVYQPYDMNMTSADLFYYEYTEGGKLYYTTVTVVPATIIYYEDDFVSFNDTTMNKWNIATGSKGQTTQDQDRPGVSDIETALDANNPYGYDNSGLLCTTYSLGSAHYVNVANGDNGKNGTANPWPTAQFTFTGTAFDLISLTGGSTGTILVDVYEGETASGNAVAHWSVDTYYGYTREQDGYIRHEWKYCEDGKWRVNNYLVEEAEQVPESQKLPKNIANADTSVTYITYEKNYVWKSGSFGNNALYQIPVIKSTPLDYGTYTVVVKLVYSKFFDHTSNGNYDFYLDAVRVYAPAEDYDFYNEQYYTQDQEGWPQFVEIRKNLITKTDLDENGEGNINGVLFIESAAEDSSVTDIRYFGPNNEVYLSQGQSVAFSLTRDDSGMVPDAVQIGAKMLSGETGTLKVTTGSSIDGIIDVKSTGDMYYTISNNLSWNGADSDLITITNTGDDIVSLTNIKITFKQQPMARFALSRSAYPASLAMSVATASYLDSISECYHRIGYYVTKQPTLESEGVITAACPDCGLTFEIIMPSLDSTEFIITSEKAPTETEDGLVVYEWTNDEYGQISISTVIPALGLPEIEYPDDSNSGNGSRGFIAVILSIIKAIRDFFAGLFR